MQPSPRLADTAERIISPLRRGRLLAQKQLEGIEVY